MKRVGIIARYYRSRLRRKALLLRRTRLDAAAALTPFVQFKQWLDASAEIGEDVPWKDWDTVLQYSGGGGSCRVVYGDFTRAEEALRNIPDDVTAELDLF